MGSYRYRSVIEGLYTLQKPYRSPKDPKLPTCGFFNEMLMKSLALSPRRVYEGECAGCIFRADRSNLQGAGRRVWGLEFKVGF